MTEWTVNITELMFALALFVNAVLFIPQAYRIYQQKRSDEVSLITFGGFWITQLLTVFHAIIKQDIILLLGYILALITCGTVIVLTIKYKKNI